MNISIQDRFVGSIIWSAFGDAIGAPFEFRSTHNIWHEINESIAAHGVEQSLCNFMSKRSFTDDTKMTLCQTDSLIRKNGFDPVDTAKSFLDWFEGGDTRGIGQITTTAMRGLQSGLPWDKAARTDDKAAGNGSAMRIAPLALYYHDSLLELRQNCDDSAKITHNCAEALAGTRAVAYAVARTTHGKDPNLSLFDEAANFAGPSDTAKKLVIAKTHFEKDSDPLVALAAIGTGFYVPETAASAIYCAARFKDAPILGIMMGIMAGGDTDTTAAVTGAILGAHVGTKTIPTNWLASLEGSKDIVDVARKLYESWFTTRRKPGV